MSPTVARATTHTTVRRRRASSPESVVSVIAKLLFLNAPHLRVAPPATSALRTQRARPRRLGARPMQGASTRTDSLGRSDVQRDVADSFDAALDAVAGLQRADAFGRAGEEQVAGLQMIE